MKRLGTIMALLAVVIFAAPAFAQEQTGSLVGKITAEGGEALPGVSVEIKGPSGTLVSVTDARGEYRFPRALPGNYKITARLQGFQTYEGSRVPVALGDRAIVNMTLKISSVMETVVVTGERVQIAVGENSTAANIAAEQISLLPKGRDFTSVVTQAPGASNEAFLGGISIDGASGAENRFVIDGIDTTRPFNGVSGQNLVTDFVEEVQVKSAGYSAEYGGSLGGVINAITKSGTNELHGTVGGYYTDSGLAGKSRPTYGESYPGLYQTFKKDDQTQLEPGLSAGGPILKDKLWFFLGYNPSFVKTERTPKGSSVTSTEKDTNQYFTGNLKGNVGSKFVYKLSANVSPVKQDGSLPNPDGSTPASVDLDVLRKYPASSYSAYADFVPSSNFYVSGRLGYYDADTSITGVDSFSQVFFRTGVIPVPETDPRFRPTGFRSVPNDAFQSTVEDRWKRKSAGVDLNYFVNALGSHAFKAGVQYEKISNAVNAGENGNQYEIRWGLADRYGLGVKGTYGSVAVRHFRTEGGAESNNLGLFFQDTWNIHRNLTLNLGVRTEQERVPNYGAKVDPTLPEWAIEFNFKDKLAPRLGFSWDVTGKQNLKVYGSYGLYYDITKLSMPRGSFGADKWVTHVYPLNTLDWASIPGGCVMAQNNLTQNPCPQLGAQKTRDLRKPTDPKDSIDPDLKPMENREFQIGADYQLTKNSVLGFRYVNKKLLNTIEDIGYLVFNPDGTSAEEYITGNPGKGVVACKPGAAFPCPTFDQAKAIRDYQALELTFDRRFTDNFSLRVNYVYSRLTGNYSGLASSDEFGRTEPNVLRYFDGLVYGYDSQGHIVDGDLNTDRPHALKINGLYRAPWGTNIGLGFSWRSGSAVSTDGSYNGVNFFPNGRNDMGRLSNITQTDLLLTHPIQIGGYNLELSVNVINLFDEDAVTRVGNVKYQDDVCDVVAACDGTNAWYFKSLVPYNYDKVMSDNHATLNPSYGKPLAYQAARAVRFGVKFAF